MSVKQFISAEDHLAKFGVTVEQAFDFIFSNVNQPDVIYSVAREHGVTNAMLSEITNKSTDIINKYFTSANIDNSLFDQTSKMINSDLGTLEEMIQFNNKVGILSNDSLKNEVLQLISDKNAYVPMFGPIYPFSVKDGFYDAEELGVDHLEDVLATDESIESLFYGGLINMFRALDESELNQIHTFPDGGNQEDFQVLLLDVLTNELPSSIVWSDEQLAEMVAAEAAEINDKFWFNPQVGMLDHSYLGLATV